MPAPLTTDAANKLFQSATLAALGLVSTAFDLVRVGWQTQGEPGPAINTDICILNCVEEDDEYNRLRETVNLPNVSTTVPQRIDYTRVWRVNWTFYGPNATDQARKLRSGLFLQPMADILNPQNVYLVTDISAPRRVPELFEGQWWERVDFECSFNEGVSELPSAPSAVGSVDVTVEDATGVIADIALP